ncbi:MAG: hypothetical protein OEY57_16340 [Nitrospirota bacterium]|nr:hypothetical protein [Nitrospirota bacterium]
MRRTQSGEAGQLALLEQGPPIRADVRLLGCPAGVGQDAGSFRDFQTRAKIGGRTEWGRSLTGV